MGVEVGLTPEGKRINKRISENKLPRRKHFGLSEEAWKYHADTELHWLLRIFIICNLLFERGNKGYATRGRCRMLELYEKSRQNF